MFVIYTVKTNLGWKVSLEKHEIPDERVLEVITDDSVIRSQNVQVGLVVRDLRYCPHTEEYIDSRLYGYWDLDLAIEDAKRRLTRYFEDAMDHLDSQIEELE